MSQALQRVIVRMLHDPVFAAAVLAGDAAPAEIAPRELQWLRRIDPRALRTDPYRRGRLLQALIEEFPVGVAVLTDGGAALDRVDAFLSSSAFHEGVQQRRATALAFGSWLAHAAPLASLELAFARARRRVRPAGAGLALAAAAWVARVPRGAVQGWQAVRQQLGPRPLEALVAGVQVPAVSLGPPDDGVLITGATPHGGSLAGVSEPIVVLLEAALEPVSRSVLVARVRALGAEPGQDAEIVDELVEDGLLTP